MPYDTIATITNDVPSGGPRPALERGRLMATTPMKPTASPAIWFCPGQPPEQDARDGGGEQRQRAVEHPRDRRRDPLLGDREHRHRDRHPHGAEEGDARDVVSVDGDRTRRREGGESEESEDHPQPGDRPRAEALQPLGDEQEGGAPDDRRDGEQPPVTGSERPVAGALRRDHQASAARRRGHRLTVCHRRRAASDVRSQRRSRLPVRPMETSGSRPQGRPTSGR